MLPVCLGMGTRLCDMLADRTKTYEAVLLLGCSTDTQDTTGTILTENREKALALDPETAEKVILGFKGDYDQIPPMYSALKVDGKKLCDLARAGKEVERKARRVQILEISILNMELPRVSIRVTCSKGTYIRTLCDDIGRELGTGGCMEHLLRTRVDRFLVEDSLKLDEIEQLRDMDGLEEKIYTVEEALEAYPAVYTLPEGDKNLKNGNPCFRQQLDLLRDARRKSGKMGIGSGFTTAKADSREFISIRKKNIGGSPGKCLTWIRIPLRGQPDHEIHRRYHRVSDHRTYHRNTGEI